MSKELSSSQMAFSDASHEVPTWKQRGATRFQIFHVSGRYQSHEAVGSNESKSQCSHNRNHGSLIEAICTGNRAADLIMPQAGLSRHATIAIPESSFDATPQPSFDLRSVSDRNPIICIDNGMLFTPLTSTPSIPVDVKFRQSTSSETIHTSR